MATKIITPIQMQDLPPKGGFAPLAYRRYLPERGPPGWLIFLGLSAYSYVNHFRWDSQMRVHAELKRERLQGELALAAAIEAERDRERMRRQVADLRVERDAMKEVDGWVVGESVYHSSNYVPPKSHIPADLLQLEIPY